MLRKIKEAIKQMPLLAIPGIFVLRVLRGFYTYRRILRDCPSGEIRNIYFMDYEGSGDTYLTCGYLDYKGMIGPEDAFAASGGLSLKIGKLFGFGHFITVTPKAALTVRVMERFYGGKLELHPLLYESEYLEYSGVLRHMEGYRGLNFMLLLRIGLEVHCGLPYDELPWKQPEFSYKLSELDECFEKYGLAEGRTVLISPYAGKGERGGIPMSFYSDIARRLRDAGFTVCTNSCDPKKEPIIPGTVPILVPHRLMRPFCERAGCFIGLRSGLCDIISGARLCKKVVLYWVIPIPSAFSSHQDFFSLNAMGLCTDAVELAYKSDVEQEIATQIVRAASS